MSKVKAGVFFTTVECQLRDRVVFHRTNSWHESFFPPELHCNDCARQVCCKKLITISLCWSVQPGLRDQCVIPRRWYVISRKWVLQDLFLWGYSPRSLLRGTPLKVPHSRSNFLLSFVDHDIISHTLVSRSDFQKKSFFNTLQALGFACSCTPIWKQISPFWSSAFVENS